MQYAPHASAFLLAEFRPGLGSIREDRRVGMQPKAPFTRYNLLSNRLLNRFDNRLYRVYKHSTGCQTRLTTGLTAGFSVYTNIQPVVK